MGETRHERTLEEINLLDESGLKFRRLKEYPLYRIYENGIIVKDRSNTNRNDLKVLSQHKSVKGYFTTYIYNNSMKGSNQRIHRLVAKAFVDGENEDNNIVNHIDGDKENNHYSNLEWCSISYNNKHAIESLGVKRYGEYNGSSKLTESEVLDMREMFSSGESMESIRNKYKNIHKNTVNSIISRRTWKHI